MDTGFEILAAAFIKWSPSRFSLSPGAISMRPFLSRFHQFSLFCEYSLPRQQVAGQVARVSIPPQMINVLAIMQYVEYGK